MSVNDCCIDKFNYILISVIPLKGCIMRSSVKTSPKTLMKVLAIAGITGSFALASSVFAQSAQQRPAPSTNQINGTFGGTQASERPATPPAPGSGIAVDGGTAGVVVNNYNSSYNTVTVNK
jgi:hypothetical protein